MRAKPSSSMPSLSRRWLPSFSSRGSTSMNATYRNVPAHNNAQIQIRFIKYP